MHMHKYKVTDPETGMAVECETPDAVSELLDVLAARRRRATTAPVAASRTEHDGGSAEDPSDAYRKARPDYGERRSLDVRRMMALKLLRKVRDNAPRATSGRALASLLGIPPRGLAGQRVFLGSVAEEIGLTSDDLVRKGRRTLEGSDWEAGDSISKGIEYLERKTGQVAANGAH